MAHTQSLSVYIAFKGTYFYSLFTYLCHPTYDNITMLHSIPPGCADLITSHVNTCRHISSRV